MIPRKSASWLRVGAWSLLVGGAGIRPDGDDHGAGHGPGHWCKLAGAQVVVGTNLASPRTSWAVPDRRRRSARSRCVSLIGYAQSTMSDGDRRGNGRPGLEAVTSAIELEAVVVNARRAAAGASSAPRCPRSSRAKNQAPIMSMADALSGPYRGRRDAGRQRDDRHGADPHCGANSISISNEPLVYADGVLVTSVSGTQPASAGRSPAA